MARDNLSISSGVIEHLQRLGVAVPAIGDQLTTDEYFAFWHAVTATDDRADLGLSIGTAVFGRSISAQAALQAQTLGDALRTIGRYKRLSCPEDVLVEVRDGEPSVRFDWVLASGEVLLGFAEPNSFARAFRTWERTTPLRWRVAHS